MHPPLPLPLLLLLFPLLTLSSPTIYLIRHGEKPSSGNGLTAQGQQRAECLINVFSPNTTYNIGYIIAEQPESNGKRSRPYDTVLPLSQSLNLTIDTSCEKTDADCVADLVKAYNGTENVLVCWEHGELTDIVGSLGDKEAPEYPDDSFNIIWTDPSPYSNITAMTSEDCPGLDN